MALFPVEKPIKSKPMMNSISLILNSFISFCKANQHNPAKGRDVPIAPPRIPVKDPTHPSIKDPKIKTFTKEKIIWEIKIYLKRRLKL